MRIYIIFEFLSIFAVSLSYLFRIRLQRSTGAALTNPELSQYIGVNVSKEFHQSKRLEVESSFARNHVVTILRELSDLFLSFRKTFIVLIIYDANVILTNTFDFQKFTSGKNILIHSFFFL